MKIALRLATVFFALFGIVTALALCGFAYRQNFFMNVLGQSFYACQERLAHSNGFTVEYYDSKYQFDKTSLSPTQTDACLDVLKNISRQPTEDDRNKLIAVCHAPSQREF